MKKIFILVIFIVISNTSNANDNYLNEFNKWLLDNGHTQYLNIEHKAGCKKLIQKHGLKVPKVGLFDEPKVKTNEWFWLECHKVQATNNLKIKFNNILRNLMRFRAALYFVHPDGKPGIIGRI